MFGLVALLYADSCRKDRNDTSFNLKPVSTVLPTTSPTQDGDFGEVVIDFDRCAPETKGIAVAFGSTRYKVVSKTENGCLMEYGGEVEIPDWDGFLDKRCVVPFNLGKQRFGRTNEGVNFSSLEPYCRSVSRSKK